MEILKGFEFQLQRFGEGTITNLATLIKNATTENKWIIWENDAYKLSNNASGAAATLTVAANNVVTAVTLNNLSQGGTSIGTIVETGALTVSITNSTEKTVTLANADSNAKSSITFAVNANFTAAAAEEDATTRTLTAVKGQVTATTGSASVNDLGTLAEGGIGVFDSDKSSEFTLVNGNFTSDKASVKIVGAAGSDTGTAVTTITTGTETGAVVTGSTGDGKLTLVSGTFVDDNIKVSTTDKIAINPGTSATVTYEDVSFAKADSATGEITGAAAVKVTGGIASRAKGSSVTAITANDILYTANTDTTAKFKASNKSVTNFTEGEITINGVDGVFDQNGDGTADLTFDSGKATVIGGTTLSIKTETFTGGSVTGAANADIKVGDTTFTNAKDTTTPALTLTWGGSKAGTEQVGVSGGTVKISASGSPTVYGVASAKPGTVVNTVTATSGDFNVSFADTGLATVEGLEEGESFTLADDKVSYTYEAKENGILKVTASDSADPTFYQNYKTSTAFTIANPDGDLTVTTGADIKVSTLPTTGTTYYDFMGFPLKSSTGAVVKVDRSSNKVDVTGSFEKKIYLNDAAAAVTDTTGETTFALDNTASLTVKGKGFTVDANGVLSDTGTNTLSVMTNTAKKTLTVKGGVLLDTNKAADTPVTFQQGTEVRDAKITLAEDVYFTLTEANSASSAVDTKWDPASNTLSGVDGDATIVTNQMSDAAGLLGTIKTTGSGTFTLNKTAYVVAEDGNGVTFNMDDDKVDTLVGIVGLDNGATVTVSGKFASDELSVGAGTTGTKFFSIETKDGITFTSTNASGNATATLYTKGDTVTRGTGSSAAVYEVLATGSASDGIVIGDTASLNTVIDALNDGDKISVTVGETSVFVYEVSNNILTAKEYSYANYTAGNAPTNSTTYTLSDGETGFTVSNATTTITSANWKVQNGETGTAINGDGVTFGTSGTVNTTTPNVTTLTNGLYVNSAGEVSSNETKAVGQISVSDTAVTYNALNDKAQTVSVTNDTADKADWVINTRGGKDNINYAASTDATINSGGGADTVGAATNGRANDLLVDAGEGKDRITVSGPGNTTVNAGTGNDVIIAGATGDTGEYLINLDSGDNEVTHTGRSGNATIVGGTGKDTIKAAGLDDVVSGGDDADTFDVSQSSMTINDYAYGTDVLQAVTTSGAAITVNPTNFGADGVVSIASGVVADVSRGTGTGDFYAVSLVDSDGKNKQNVAWAKEGGSTIDITTYDQAVTLIGDDDGKNALYAGTKADDIYSYADNDSVYGGAGKDAISLSTVASGRVVGVATTSGKDTVSGFKASFEEGDSIYMVDGSASDVKASFANNTVTFKDGEGSLQLNNVATSSTGAVELNVSGAKVALAAASVGGAIAADSTSYADFYMGNDAGVSFAAAEGEVNVDLRNGLDSGAEGAKFSGIIAVAGGAGQNTLIGGTAGETLTAGTGVSSLWGGAGKDSLIGSTASDAFFIGAGDGSDVVTNFSAAGNENADTVYALNDITGAKLTSNGVEISVSDTDKLTLKSVTADTAIKFNSNGNAGVAKVGSATNANNFSYDSTVTYYGGGSKSDKIAFASGSTENAEIWLDGSQGKAYASIDVVDGTNASGNLLVAGDSSSQSIIGGKGDTSLWGGAGNATDTLKSSSTGKTMFWWGAGEGNDVVVSASTNDSVNLYNLKLSDVDVANSSITNSGVSLALNDGSKLTVQTSRDMNFTIDGQSWTAQHNSKEWKQNS